MFLKKDKIKPTPTKTEDGRQEQPPAREGGVTIQDLPDELLSLTFSFMSGKEILGRAAPVCKRWQKATNNQLLWKELCTQKGWIEGEGGEEPTDWKAHYKSSKGASLVVV